MTLLTTIRYVALCIGAAVLLVLGLYLGALLVAHRGNPDFLSIDSCLDDSRRWNYEQRACDKPK